MPRVHHVKKARKSQKDYGIKKGESYYWWKFRRGGKRISKTYPKRSQLTQSNFYATLWDCEDNLASVISLFEQDKADFGDLASALHDAANEVENLGEECQSSYDNMPEGLQQGDTGQLLENRVSMCQELSGYLEDAASNVENFGDEEPPNRDEAKQAAEDISWDIT